MSKKFDLESIFNLKGVIKFKTMLTETKEDLKQKNPHQWSQEVKTLMDEITACIFNNDIEGVITRIEAARLRIDTMGEAADAIKIMLDKKKNN